MKAKVAVRAADDCKRVRRKGQVDRALCDRVMARMGYVATMVEMYDFSDLPAERGADLAPVFEFAAVDNLAMSCAPGAHFLQRSLVKWRFADVDRDGQEELVIDLAVGDGVVTKAVFAACSAENEAAPTKGLPARRRDGADLEVDGVWPHADGGDGRLAQAAGRDEEEGAGGVGALIGGRVRARMGVRPLVAVRAGAGRGGGARRELRRRASGVGARREGLGGGAARRGGAPVWTAAARRSASEHQPWRGRATLHPCYRVAMRSPRRSRFVAPFVVTVVGLAGCSEPPPPWC